jgi:hypothetical protein
MAEVAVSLLKQRRQRDQGSAQGYRISVHIFHTINAVQVLFHLLSSAGAVAGIV